jgi:hypothetical protein
MAKIDLALVCLSLTAPALGRAQTLPASQPAPASAPVSSISLDEVSQPHPTIEAASRAAPPRRPRAAPFVFSALGPGRGRSAFSLGVGALLVVPALELNYLRGVSPSLAMYGRLDALAAVGAVTRGAYGGELSLGVRYLVVADPRAAVALRAGLSLKGGFLAESLVPAVPGAELGLILSVGDSRAQGSFSLDAGPLFSAGDARLVAGYARSAFTAELPKAMGGGVYLQVLLLFLFAQDAALPIPGAIIGLRW